MLKKYLKPFFISSVFTLLPILIGLLLWKKLPEEIPMHWNIKGEVDGFGSKGTFVFLFPLFLWVIHVISVLAAFLDPKNKNQNKKVYGLIFFATPFISILMSCAVYANALGFSFQMESIMALLFGIIFFFLGNYLPKCKRNYTIGIKIVWALDDEENWNATHRFTGKLWTASSLLFFIFIFIPKVSMLLSLILICIIVLVPVIYSYLFYRKKNKNAQ